MALSPRTKVAFYIPMGFFCKFYLIQFLIHPTNIVGPNVVFENFWALDGQIVGSHNLTVITGLFEDDPEYLLLQRSHTSFLFPHLSQCGYAMVHQWHQLEHTKHFQLHLRPSELLQQWQASRIERIHALHYGCWRR